MELPRRFPYNPQWRIILFGLAFGGAILILGRIYWIFLLFGILFVTFALLLAIRRLAFPRFLQLEQESLLIPKGFCRAWVAKVLYADIGNWWETGRGSTRTLNLQVKGQMIEINSIMLPDMASYFAVRDFVKARVIPKEKPVELGKYGFWCSYFGNGEIYNSNGEVIWHFKTLHTRPRYPYGLFRVPDFVVCDRADKELFRIRLQRKWPLARFKMTEDGSPICTFQQRSFLRNSFTFAFTDGQKWVFRMPLFTGRFGGLFIKYPAVLPQAD